MQVTQITELNELTNIAENTNEEGNTLNSEPQPPNPYQLILKVSIDPEDYTEEVKKRLKKIVKNADIKGFRPGHVPIEYAKKRFAKDVTREVVLELMNVETDKYCKENDKKSLTAFSYYNHSDFDKKYNLHTNETFELVWHTLTEPTLNFDFDFDSSTFDIPDYVIEVTQEDLDEQIKLIQNHLGERQEVAYIEQNSALNVQLEELNPPDNFEPIENQTMMLVNLLNEELAEKLVKLQVGDSIEIPIFETQKSEKTKEAIIKHLLNNPENRTPENISTTFKMTILKSRTIVPSPLNTELFNAISPDITNEEQLRGHLERELEIEANNVAHRLKHQKVRKIIFDAAPEFRYPFSQFLTLAYINPESEKKTQKQIYEQAYESAMSVHEQILIKYLLEKYELKLDYETVQQTAMIELYQVYLKNGRQVDIMKISQEAESLLKDDREFNAQCINKTAIKITFDFLKEKLRLTEHHMTYTEFIKELPKIEESLQIKF